MAKGFEMYEYRQALLDMRQNATDRAIARAKLMGRKKARELREIADGSARRTEATNDVG